MCPMTEIWIAAISLVFDYRFQPTSSTDGHFWNSNRSSKNGCFWIPPSETSDRRLQSLAYHRQPRKHFPGSSSFKWQPPNSTTGNRCFPQPGASTKNRCVRPTSHRQIRKPHHGSKTVLSSYAHHHSTNLWIYPGTRENCVQPGLDLPYECRLAHLRGGGWGDPV